MSEGTLSSLLSMSLPDHVHSQGSVSTVQSTVQYCSLRGTVSTYSRSYIIHTSLFIVSSRLYVCQSSFGQCV